MEIEARSAPKLCRVLSQSFVSGHTDLLVRNIIIKGWSLFSGGEVYKILSHSVEESHKILPSSDEGGGVNSLTLMLFPFNSTCLGIIQSIIVSNVYKIHNDMCPILHTHKYMYPQIHMEHHIIPGSGTNSCVVHLGGAQNSVLCVNPIFHLPPCHK